MLAAVPGLSYADRRVTFMADDFRAAYDGLLGLVTVARGGYAQVMSEVGRGLAGPEFGAAYSDALFDRWMDFESGRWSSPPAAMTPARTYHGFH